MMRRFEVIERAIETRWGNDPAVGICRTILEFAVSKPDEKLVMLTFADFKRLAGVNYHQEELQRSIAILVSRYHALEMRLVFIDDEEGPIYLNQEEQEDFLNTGKLMHPHYGEVVEDGKNQTFPYYIAKPSVLLEEVML